VAYADDTALYFISCKRAKVGLLWREAMQIHVVFEQDELLTNAINQKPFMFMIWWEHEGNTYPCEGWFDRGVYWMLEWFHIVDHLYTLIRGLYGSKLPKKKLGYKAQVICKYAS
jgi:hypothetical protein